jgi:hypothetical protein
MIVIHGPGPDIVVALVYVAAVAVGALLAARVQV